MKPTQLSSAPGGRKSVIGASTAPLVVSPEANNGPTLAQMEPAAPEAEKPKRTISRQKRIQAKAGSFRPGPGTKKITPRSLTLFIPVFGKLGTDEEFNALREAAAQIPQHYERASVVAVGVDEGEIYLKLRVPSPGEGSDDDDVVSELFQELEPFYTGSPLFQAAADVPRWEYRIGDFVADKGSFA